MTSRVPLFQNSPIWKLMLGILSTRAKTFSFHCERSNNQMLVNTIHTLIKNLRILEREVAYLSVQGQVYGAQSVCSRNLHSHGFFTYKCKKNSIKMGITCFFERLDVNNHNKVYNITSKMMCISELLSQLC